MILLVVIIVSFVLKAMTESKGKWKQCHTTLHNHKWLEKSYKDSLCVDHTWWHMFILKIESLFNIYITGENEFNMDNFSLQSVCEL